MRKGRELMGYGMATGIWEALRVPTSAKAELAPDGEAGSSAPPRPILAPVPIPFWLRSAARCLGSQSTRSMVRIGNSDLPQCPVEGGSMDSGVGRLGGNAGL